MLLLDSVNLDFLIWILDSFSCCICCFPEPQFSRNLSCQKFFCLFVFLPEEKVFIFLYIFNLLTFLSYSSIAVRDGRGMFKACNGLEWFVTALLFFR